MVFLRWQKIQKEKKINGWRLGRKNIFSLEVKRAGLMQPLCHRGHINIVSDTGSSTDTIRKRLGNPCAWQPHDCLGGGWMRHVVSLGRTIPFSVKAQPPQWSACCKSTWNRTSSNLFKPTLVHNGLFLWMRLLNSLCLQSSLGGVVEIGCG